MAVDDEHVHVDPDPDSNQSGKSSGSHHEHYFSLASQIQRSRWERWQNSVISISRPGAYIFGGAALIIAIGFVVLFVPQIVYHSLSTTANNKLTAESNLRSSLVQAIVGLAVLAGLYFTARNLTLSRSAQITDRFSKQSNNSGIPI